MPIRVPHHTVRVRRDGKNITPKIGVPFEFTDEEVAEVQALHPHALRRAVVERLGVQPEVTSAVEPVDAEDADPVQVKETPKPLTAAQRRRAAAADAGADDDNL